MVAKKDGGRTAFKTTFRSARQPAAGRGAFLLVCEDDHAFRRVPLEKVETTIGRLPENDVVLDSRGVSRRHARIFVEGGRHFIEDLGSANGTVVNDTGLTQLTPHPLAGGDTIFVYRRMLVFFSDKAGNIDVEFDPKRFTFSIKIDGARVERDASEILERFFGKQSDGGE